MRFSRLIAPTLLIASLACDVPAPKADAREVEAVAAPLERWMSADARFQAGSWKVLRGWSWSWGRNRIFLQVWGVDAPSLRQEIVDELGRIRIGVRPSHSINVEFLHGLPGEASSRRIEIRSI